MIQALFIFYFLMICSCGQAQSKPEVEETHLRLGAACTESYLPLVKNKKVGLVVNQSSLVEDVHLLDFLRAHQVNVGRVFSPEHGFRGEADAGAWVKDGVDVQTGVTVVSLYGKQKKPKQEHLTDLAYVIFDIQDVGVRFYTYISTLHYVMEACAEAKVPLIVLDRPNPNGHYVAGPVLDTLYRSFVGMHPIPVVHGLTVGELACMINGERWLQGGIRCELKIVEMQGWTHSSIYELPVRPSPNLPNARSIALYPSLCFFEPTVVSIGRGTDSPFQVYGVPQEGFGPFDFTPQSVPGAASNPKHQGRVCYGEDLRKEDRLPPFTLHYLLDAYAKCKDKSVFFTRPDFFNLLAGNADLIEQIKAGMSEAEIVKSWAEALNTYMTIRKQYLLYD